VTDSLRGLVLRQVDYGEADRMVSLLTAERGRIEARVPGVRKSRKRFGGLDLYVLAEFEFQQRRGRSGLVSAQVVNSWPGIRVEIERLALAAYAAELLLQAVPEDAPAADAFRLAEAAFSSLDLDDGEAHAGQGWARAFELKLLHVLGCRPMLRRCAHCGEATTGRDVRWSVTSGGVVAGHCIAETGGTQPIAPGVVQLLDQSLHLPLAEQTSLDWDAEQRRSAQEIMVAFVTSQVGRRDRARRFLEQVVGGGLALAMAMLFIFSGCGAPAPLTAVRVQGFLYGDRAPTEDSLAISGSEVSAWSDSGELLQDGSEPFADFPGFYRFSDLPPQTSLHLQFSAAGEEQVTTLISGRTAVDDLYVDPGTFHLWSRELALQWSQDWAAVSEGKTTVSAPTFDPIVVGEGGLLRGALLDPAEHVGTRLLALDSSGIERELWYTDDEGLAVAGGGTSADGGFARFGLVPGPVQVRVLAADGSSGEEVFVTLVVEDAITSLFDFAVF